MPTPTVAVARTALIAACAGVAIAWPAATARAQQSDAIVFAGLRPAADRLYQQTEIRRLSEAQRLRAMVEDVTREITGRPVLNHAALRAALGSAYLVDFVDCRGERKCVSAALAKMRSRSAFAVYGDYAAEGKRYRVRMRIIDLAGGQLLAEVEFSLTSKDLDDRERWKTEMAVLFGAVEGVLGTPSEGGGTSEPSGGEAGGGGETKDPTEGGEAGGGSEPAGGGGTESGGGAPSSGGGESSGSGRDIDELTDADFGVTVAPPPAALAGSRRTDHAMIEVSGALSLMTRRFRYIAEEDVDPAQGFKSAWTSRAGASVAVYPLAVMGSGRLNGLGLLAGYSRTLASGSSSTSVRASRLYLGAGYRIAIGTTATNPTFLVSAGYMRDDAEALDDEVDLPDTSYRGASLGADIHMPILTPRFAINGGFRYLIVAQAGEIVEPTYFGRSKVGGLDLEGSLEIRPTGFMFVRVGGSFTAFDFELGDNGGESNLGAIGAQDRFIAATVTTGLLL